MLYSNIGVNKAGHLTFAGYDTTELAREFKTPLYLLDEARIRANMRLYTENFRKYFGVRALPLFASKALSFTGIYKIAASEGMGADAVSCGEIQSAVNAGFPAEKLYFHGNNKTDEDIRFAMEREVGCFVADSREELDAINSIAGDMGKKQKVMLRLTPGIDPHTFAAVNTGTIDSQFGVPIQTGQAMELAIYALGLESVSLCGFHCHVGSQIFEWTPFRDAAGVMLRFIAGVKEKTGFEAEELNLGGGYGVRYTEEDPNVDIPGNIEKLAAYIKERCDSLKIKVPFILMEPGRSIVADAGITLYSVGTVKSIPGGNTYVSIDGGMTDNPRFALYRSRYTLYNATKAAEEADLKCIVVGRCCETGDRVQENIFLARPERGDIIAVLTTGAYNFAMSSNYNRLCRPPVVIAGEKGPYVAVRRETIEDLVERDM